MRGGAHSIPVHGAFLRLWYGKLTAGFFTYHELKSVDVFLNVCTLNYQLLAGRPVPWTGLLKCEIEMLFPPYPSLPPGGRGWREGRQ